MKLLRFVCRASAASVWVFCGLLVIGVCYPVTSLALRLWLKQHWSATLLWLCGVRVTRQGIPANAEAVLWVSNHISWLDIFALNAVRATAFIAKSEIRRWPILGWLVAGAGTIFIERASRHAVHRVGIAMQAHFARGQAVGLFPEGTTSSGFDLLPFYANLFEPARKSAVKIQPVALLYFHHEARSDLAAFVGEQTLLNSFWQVLSAEGLSIQMTFLTPILQAGAQCPPARAELGRLARESIRACVVAVQQP